MDNQILSSFCRLLLLLVTISAGSATAQQDFQSTLQSHDELIDDIFELAEQNSSAIASLKASANASRSGEDAELSEAVAGLRARLDKLEADLAAFVQGGHRFRQGGESSGEPICTDCNPVQAERVLSIGNGLNLVVLGDGANAVQYASDKLGKYVERIPLRSSCSSLGHILNNSVVFREQVKPALPSTPQFWLSTGEAEYPLSVCRLEQDGLKWKSKFVDGQLAMVVVTQD